MKILEEVRHEFGRHRSLAERAMVQLSDLEFFQRPAAHVNSVAIVVKHIAGNLISRWTDFLTTDGEKPNRDRDGEFVVTDRDTRANLQAAWERGWQTLLTTVAGLHDADLDRMVTIRGEPHTAGQALLRAMTHVAYHTGQILYIARLLRPDGTWLTVPPGQSQGFPGTYSQTK